MDIESESTARQPAASRPVSTWAAGLVLAGLVAAVYLPTVFNGFVWDDERNLATATFVAGDASHALVADETSRQLPFARALWAGEVAVWGDQSWGFHLVSVLLHGLASLLAWRVLSRLAVPGAWLAAAVFAVHPLAVESVAWVSQQPTLLAGVLALGATWTYFCYTSPAGDVTRGSWLYAVSMALFGSALCASTVVIALPAVLLVVCWWKRGRLAQADLVRLLPFFALMILVPRLVGFSPAVTGGDEWDLTLVQRIPHAAQCVWFYAARLAVPWSLAFFYPRWSVAPSAWWQFVWLAALVVLLCGLWWQRHAIGRGPLAATLAFVFLLLPTLGLFEAHPFRYAFVADHWLYQAALPLLALAAAGLTLAIERRPTLPGWMVPATATAIVLPLAAVAHWRTHAFVSLDTLNEDTVARNPDSWPAHQSLGNARMAAKDYSGAGEHLGRVLEIQSQLAESFPDEPGFRARQADAYVNLAFARQAAGYEDEATAAQAKAVAIRKALLEQSPDHDEYLNSIAAGQVDIGLSQQRKGQHAEAIASFRDAASMRDKLLRKYPDVVAYQIDLAATYDNLAVSQEALGQNDEAAASHLVAIEIREPLLPKFPEVTGHQVQLGWNHAMRGVLLQRGGRLDEAERALRRALELRARLVLDNPDAADYYGALGWNCAQLAVVLRSLGRLPDAEKTAEQAVQVLSEISRLRPAVVRYRDDLGWSYFTLGATQFNLGKTTEAEAALQKAIEIRGKLAAEEPGVRKFQDDLATSYLDLAQLFFSTQRPDEAEKTLRQAIEVREKWSRDHPESGYPADAVAAVHVDIGVLQAAQGRVAEAEQSLKQAIETREKLVRAYPQTADFQFNLAWTYLHLANLKWNQNERPAAEQAYRRVVELREALVNSYPQQARFPTDLAAALVRLADVEAELGQWPSSFQSLERAIAAGDQSWSTVCRMALVSLATGNESQYRQSCQELMDRFEKVTDPYARFLITLTLVSDKQSLPDMDRVVRFAQRAADANPEDPVQALLAGAARYRAGKAAEAAEAIDGALDRLSREAVASPERAQFVVLARAISENLRARALNDQISRRESLNQAQTLRGFLAKPETKAVKPSGMLPPWIIGLTIERTLRDLDQLVAQDTSPGDADKP